MFTSKEEFTGWLQANASESLNSTISELADDIVVNLRTTYEEYGSLESTPDMMSISSAIGQAIPLFMKLANATGGQLSNAHKKVFVIDNALALFRLIDRGISGTEKRLAGGDIAMMFPDGDMEEVFVKPLAEQAVEQAYQMWKSMGIENLGS